MDAIATSFAASLVDPASHVTWCHAPALADLFEADPRWVARWRACVDETDDFYFLTPLLKKKRSHSALQASYLFDFLSK